MKRALVIAGLVTALVAGRAEATGSVVFTPLGPTVVPIGTQIDFSVEIQAATDFWTTAVFIGSGDVTDLGFSRDAAWTTAFQSGIDDLLFDEPAPPQLAQNVFLQGDTQGPGSAGPNLLAGTLSIITTGMPAGTYSVEVSENDSFTFTPAEDPDPIPLAGSLSFTLTPEPGGLALLALGSLWLGRRRR